MYKVSGVVRYIIGHFANRASNMVENQLLIPVNPTIRGTLRLAPAMGNSVDSTTLLSILTTL